MLVNSSNRLGIIKERAVLVAVSGSVPSGGGTIGNNQKTRQGTSREGTSFIRCLVAFFVLLLPVNGWATKYTVNDAGDLPFTTRHTYDTIVVDADSIVSTSTGWVITLAHDHCVLDLNGNTLFLYGTVLINADTCSILNGTLEEPVGAVGAGGRINIGTGKRHTTLTDVSAHARSKDCGGLYSHSAIELEINGGNWTSYVTDFTSREYSMTAPIQTNESNAGIYDIPQRFRAWIHNITVDSCPHMAMDVRGGRMWIDSNNITVDAQNNYTYPSGNMFYGVGNAYGIAMGRPGPGTRIIGNTIRSGTNHRGGRGIAVGMSASHVYGGNFVDDIEIAGNDVSVHAGPDAYYGDTYMGIGLRLREGQNNVYVHDNVVTVYADTATATTHTGPQANAFWGTPLGTGWRIENNQFKAVGVSGLYGDNGVSYTCAFALESVEGTDSYSRGNRFSSDCTPIRFGEVNSNSSIHSENWHFYGDTVDRLTPSYIDNFNADGAIVMARYGSHCENNYMVDPVFTGDSTIVWGGDGVGEMTIQRLFRITVIGNDGIPCEGARVRIRNAYGLNTVVGMTGRYGTVNEFAAAVKYMHSGIGSDSTYSPFTISAIYGTDSVAITETAVGFLTNLNDTLRLNYTGGTGILDTIPPGTVGDLSVVPGSIPGHFVFGWTSTGNDGIVGAADYDSIRYSVSAINTFNWGAAVRVPRTSPPKTYGVHDQVDITGSVPGRFYYVGIKAFDSSGHSSPLSVDSGFARGILTPQIAADMISIGVDSLSICVPTVRSYLQLTYEFQLAFESTFGSPESAQITAFDTHACGLFPIPPDHDIVYARCRAMALDESEISPWSATRAFSVSGGEVNQPPDIPVAFSPLPGDTMTSLTPILMVANSADAEGDPITYQFELYNATGTTRLAASGTVAEGIAYTSWSVPSGIVQDDTSYRLTARSYDGGAYSSWMNPVTFHVVELGTGAAPMAAVVRAYPNPVHFAAGEQVTFVLPDNPVDLTIMTVSGDIVLRREGLSGRWVWNGGNQSGAQVAVGLYLWFVSDDQGQGKLVVKP